MPTNLHDVESVLLDVELLVKYRMFDRAATTLEQAISVAPKNIQLREKICSLCMDHGLRQKAIEHLLSLSSLYIETGQLDRANAVLLHVKRLNPQLSITSRLHALRQAEQQKAQPPAQPPAANYPPPTYRQTPKVMTGDLASVSLFDVVQVMENSRITGVIFINASTVVGRIYFNEGQIADADVKNLRGVDAFRKLADAQDGVFEIEKSAAQFKQNIQTTSNTSLILDMLRELDEERAGMDGDESAQQHVH